MRTTVPAQGAFRVFITFITSRMQSVVVSSIAAPSLTKGSASGAGDR